MENNKLNNLFDAARQQKPSVSFDEAMDMLHKKADDSKYVGGAGIFRFRNLFLGAISALVIVGGTYLAFRNDIEKKELVREQQAYKMGAGGSDLNQPASTPEIVSTMNNTYSKEKKVMPGVTEESSAIDNNIPAEEVVIAKPVIKNKDEHFGSIVKNAYLLENQTVNISNEKGKFRIHFNGSDVAKLEMNSTQLPQEEWENYQDIIAEAKTVKSSMGINSANTGNKKFVDYLFSTLKEKGLIENNLSSIRFSKDGLLIDGVEADSAVRQQLVDRYKILLGEEIGSRTLYFN